MFRLLSKSGFRSRFRLGTEESEYLQKKGMETIMKHAQKFVIERLSAAEPANDGKQTPMRNHPVFIAQHATATCCRKCLAKWNKIPIGKALTEEEIEYIIMVIRCWLEMNLR